MKLSDLNDAWGNALSDLSAREGKLKEGIALAEKYQVWYGNQLTLERALGASS